MQMLRAMDILVGDAMFNCRLQRWGHENTLCVGVKPQLRSGFFKGYD